MQNTATVESRHGVIADDSSRVCIILPSEMVRDMKSIRNGSRPTISAVAREFIAIGIEKERQKNVQRAEN